MRASRERESDDVNYILQLNRAPRDWRCAVCEGRPAPHWLERGEHSSKALCEKHVAGLNDGDQVSDEQIEEMQRRR